MAKEKGRKTARFEKANGFLTGNIITSERGNKDELPVSFYDATKLSVRERLEKSGIEDVEPEKKENQKPGLPQEKKEEDKIGALVESFRIMKKDSAYENNNFFQAEEKEKGPIVEEKTFAYSDLPKAKLTPEEREEFLKIKAFELWESLKREGDREPTEMFARMLEMNLFERGDCERFLTLIEKNNRRTGRIEKIKRVIKAVADFWK